MADLTEWGARPHVRSRIRQLVRERKTPDDIETAVRAQFEDDNGRIAGLATSTMRRMITQESRRDQVVKRIEDKAKGERTNLHSLVGCGKGERIQASITLQWYDETTDTVRRFGHTTTLDNQGRLQDILNKAIREVTEFARNRGYQPSHVTSSMLSGTTRYRLEYVECVGQ